MARCQRRCEKALLEGRSVVIDNLNCDKQVAVIRICCLRMYRDISFLQTRSVWIKMAQNHVFSLPFDKFFAYDGLIRTFRSDALCSRRPRYKLYI